MKREFKKLRKPIKILLFLSTKDDSTSLSVLEFMNVIVNQDPQIDLKVFYKETHSESFEQQQIQEIPAIVIEGTGICYTGVPSGPESGVFIQTLIMKSTENSGVGEVISKILASVTKPVKLRSIMTSQCTICPLAVKIGNTIALESAINGNGKITHEIVEALEHKNYVAKYDLSAVPIIIINNKVTFHGLPDVDKYVMKIAEAGR